MVGNAGAYDPATNDHDLCCLHATMIVSDSSYLSFGSFVTGSISGCRLRLLYSVIVFFVVEEECAMVHKLTVEQVNAEVRRFWNAFASKDSQTLVRFYSVGATVFNSSSGRYELKTVAPTE